MLRWRSRYGTREWPKKRSRGSVADGRAVSQSISPAATKLSTTSSEQKKRGRSPWTRPTNGVRSAPRRLVKGLAKLSPRARANGFPSCAGERREAGRLLGGERHPTPADPDAGPASHVVGHVLVRIENPNHQLVERTGFDQPQASVRPDEHEARVVHPGPADDRVAEPGEE